MRKLFPLILLLALPVFAQSPAHKLMQGADNPPQDEKTKARIRTEGSAGGTGERLSEEAKKAVGAGAGPHLQQKDTPYKRRVHRESESERQAAREAKEK